MDFFCAFSHRVEYAYKDMKVGHDYNFGSLMQSRKVAKYKYIHSYSDTKLDMIKLLWLTSTFLVIKTWTVANHFCRMKQI